MNVTTTPAYVLKTCKFHDYLNGIPVPVVCAAGEPKRGPLSCLLCPSTRALGAKRPKTDIIYLIFF